VAPGPPPIGGGEDPGLGTGAGGHESGSLADRRHAGAARGEGTLARGGAIHILKVPRLPAVRSDQGREPPADVVTPGDAVPPVPERKAVVEGERVTVDELDLPVEAAIHGLVDT
jgi:hypothetical protein